MSASLRSFTDFILHSRLRAIGVAFALTFIPLIGTASTVIAGFITLRKGALEGFWVFIAATLPYFLLLPFQPMPLGIWVVGIIALSNLFTWGFAVLLNRYGNWSLVLELTALIGIMVVTTAHVLKPDLELWWGKQLSTYLTQMLPDHEAQTAATASSSEKTEAVHEVSEESSTEPDLISFVNAAKPYATGLLMASLFFTALLQLFVSRWWQLMLTDPKKLSFELQQIRLSSMAGFVFLITLILSYMKIALAQDMLPALYLAFCLAGLSLAHYAGSKFKTFAWLWLFVFYFVLLSSWLVYRLPLGFQLLAMVALLDVWFDWRGYLDKRFPG